MINRTWIPNRERTSTLRIFSDIERFQSVPACRTLSATALRGGHENLPNGDTRSVRNSIGSRVKKRESGRITQRKQRLNQLEYGLQALLKRDEIATEKQRNISRETALLRAAADLNHLGYKHMTADGLQQKHVLELIDYWTKIGHKPDTITVRLSAIRWWAKQVDRESAVAKKSKSYRLDEIAEVTKSLMGNFDEKLSKISDPHANMSLRLQAAFGLNVMESIKIRPAVADQGYSLAIKNTWRGKNTKMGRILLFEEPLQRVALDDAKALAEQTSGAMIPEGRNYIEQRRVYERHLARAGFSQEIGGQYRYVLWRYRRLTGRDAPAEGGPSLDKMSLQSQKEHAFATRRIDDEVADVHPKAVRAILESNHGMPAA